MEAFPIILNPKKIRFEPFHQIQTQNTYQCSKSLKNINPRRCFQQVKSLNSNQKARISKSYKLIQQQSDKEDLYQNLIKKIQKVKIQYEAQHINQQKNLSFSHKIKNKINSAIIQRKLKKAKTQVKLQNLTNQNKYYQSKDSTLKLNFQENQAFDYNDKCMTQNKQSEVKNEILDIIQMPQRCSYIKNEIESLHFKFDYQILDKAQVRHSINIGQELLLNITKSNKQQIPNQHKKQISISDFQIGKSIGSGKFGQVFICKHKNTNFIFALKKIFKSTITQYKMADQLINQLKINYTFHHPNIVKLYGHFQDQYHIFFIMEYAPDGCVIDNLNSKKSQKYSSQVLYQTLNAIEAIHKKNVVHRDIKPENIVVFFDNTYKICDFGLSAIIKNQMKHTFCGTADYVSPQMKEVGEYSQSVDIWSLGILCFQLIVGYAPFKEKINEWKKSGWKKNNFWKWSIEYPTNISTEALVFMKNLLRQKPQDRWNLSQCKRSQFIIKTNVSEMQIQQQAANNRFSV